MTDRKAVLDSIAREEQRLAALEAEVKQSRAALDRLRKELASLGPDEPPRQREPVARRGGAEYSSAEKVALFRSLFRGRDDVFPRRWENRKTGRSGYSPVCANEWEYGICEKKRQASSGKAKGHCGECSNRAFIPVGDREILKHLQGRQVIGIYPLLEDETCRLLAADFDKQSWTEDVGAFAETCRDLGIPVAVERSRSGNGAHAWFFFRQPVPAVVARKMGCHLLTETMSRRHQLGMESYDRLFPNQDTMPRGGFGNLIALPFQYEVVREGNTVFLDEAFSPYPKQWEYLAGIRKIESSRVQEIADEATRQGSVISVRFGRAEGESDTAPWERPPSGRRRKARISGPLPREIQVVLAQRLFIDKAGLPSALLNEIKRIAAFQNPEFYKRQSMRLSTARTPRVIACAEELEHHIALPRGCGDDLSTLLGEYGVSIRVADRRCDGKPLELRFQGQLTLAQERAAHALLDHDFGVFVAPPGVGKTVVGIFVAAERACSTLVLVHRQPLLEQWREQLAMFLGIDIKAIGQIGGGKRKPNGRLDVAMIQSLVRKGQVNDLVAEYGHVVVDECHHIPAFSFERVLAEVRARHITGLTATPQRLDGHHPIAHMQLGPVRYTVESKSQAAYRPFDHRLIVRETGFTLDGGTTDKAIQEVYALLARDERRNDLIFDDVVRSLAEGRSPILLTERKDHLEYFAWRLREFARHLVVLQGGMRARQRREAIGQLASIPDNEERLILATGRYIGEGFDDSRLDTLFLALPISWKGTLVQYAGRLHRLHPGKSEVRIYDYVDRDVPVLMRMFEKRLRGYRAIGYARDETPLGYSEETDEPLIEYDEEVLQFLDDVE